MCFLSVLSEASYCVTHADSTVPHLYYTFAAAYRKGVAFVSQTWHLIPARNVCLHKLYGLIVNHKNLSFTKKPVSGTRSFCCFLYGFLNLPLSDNTFKKPAGLRCTLTILLFCRKNTHLKYVVVTWQGRRNNTLSPWHLQQLPPSEQQLLPHF